MGQPFITLNDVNDYNDRGLIGIAIDPDFNNNQHVYLAYTYENHPEIRNLPADSKLNHPEYDGKKTARVVRVTANGNQSVPGSNVVILGNVGGNADAPSCTDYPAGSDCIASDSGSHSVGGVRFGNDGKLYVATGDGAGFFSVDLHAFRAQDLNHLSGKILRINKDGTAPGDNPFYNGDPNSNQSKVYAYGLRNPYRFNFHPNDGRLIGGDVGWFNKEEINVLQPGKNYGWPCREGAAESFNGYEVQVGCPIIGGTQDPVFDYDHIELVNDSGEVQYNADGTPQKVGVVTAGSFATSDVYPEFFRGSFLYSDFVLDHIKFLRFNGNSELVSVGDFASSDIGTPVEYVTGPDGLVYYVSLQFDGAQGLSGEIRRFNYNNQGGANIQPIAEFSASSSATAPFISQFDASSSRDPAGQNLTYIWDFGDGQNGQGQYVEHTYNQEGVYNVELTVTSERGTFTKATRRVEFDSANNSLNSDPVSTAVRVSDGPLYFALPTQIEVDVLNQKQGLPFVLQVQIEKKELGGAGAVVYTQNFEEISLGEGETRTYTTTWSPGDIGRYTVTVNFYTYDPNVNYGLGEFGNKMRFFIDTAVLQVVTRDPGGNQSEPTEPVPNNNCVDTPPIGDNKGWDGANCHVNGDPWVDGVSNLPGYQIGDTGTGGPVVITPTEPIVPTEPVPNNNCVDTPPMGDNKGWDGANCHVNGDPWVDGVSNWPGYQIGDTATGGPVVTTPIEPVPPTTPTEPVPSNNCVDTPPIGDNKGWDGDNCHVNGDPWVDGVSNWPGYQPGDTAMN